MTTSRSRRHVRQAATVTVAALGLALSLASPAFASNDGITNGGFQQPGTDGVTPTDWTPTNFGNESGPYDASIDTNDVDGSYPPPSGTPGGDTVGNFAVENYYEVGSSTGVEGFGGAQTLASPVAGSTGPQLSWSTAETYFPPTASADWAGSAVEVDFTSGASSYQLRYINPFTPSSGSYSASPTGADTATTKYVVLSPLTDGAWYTQPAVDVASGISAQFGFTSFTITAVDFINLEDVTATYPYANMTSFWKNISLVPGGPNTALPESPLAVGMPLAGLGVIGVAVALQRRRHRSA